MGVLGVVFCLFFRWDGMPIWCIISTDVISISMDVIISSRLSTAGVNDENCNKQSLVEVKIAHWQYPQHTKKHDHWIQIFSVSQVHSVVSDPMIIRHQERVKCAHFHLEPTPFHLWSRWSWSPSDRRTSRPHGGDACYMVLEAIPYSDGPGCVESEA